MKTQKTTLFVSVISAAVLCFIFSTSSFASSDGISWVSYPKGISQAEREEKKIMISFYADWCAYCKEMDQKTFKDPAVVSYINKNFIPIRINTEKDRKTAQLFRVRGLPDTWFMSETKEIIGHRPGFIPADTMIQFLRYINTGSYKSMSLKNFMDKN